MSSWAKPGVKVVCVDDTWLGLHGSPLKKGQTYTVKYVAHGTGINHFGQVSDHLICVELLEAENPEDREFPHLPKGFDCDRFRPLVTRTQAQDLEQFIPLLTNNQVPA